MPLRSTLRAVLQTVYLASLGSLQSGALLDYATGSLYQHESTLFRSLWPRLSEGDILLGDRAFCSYSSMAALGQRSGLRLEIAPRP